MVEFTPEVGEQVCAHIAYGMSLRQIEKIDGMPSKRAVFYWLMKGEVLKTSEPEHPLVAFLHQYAHAREAQADALAEEILEIADDNEHDSFIGEDGRLVVNNELVQRSRLRVDSRKWLAGKLRPKKYGDKIVQEQTGPDGGPLQVEHAVTGLTTEELRKLINQ